jgi:excisionase family DNA binding protein
MTLKDFLTVDELSQYLNIKKSTLYTMVETGAIIHYRVGKLIRFKKEDVDDWMEGNRREGVPLERRTTQIFRTIHREVDIDRIVKKSIEEVKNLNYIPPQEKPGRVKGLRKEVEDGII